MAWRRGDVATWRRGGVASVEGHVRGVGHGGHAHVGGVRARQRRGLAARRRALEHGHALPLVQVLHWKTNNYYLTMFFLDSNRQWTTERKTMMVIMVVTNSLFFVVSQV